MEKSAPEVGDKGEGTQGPVIAVGRVKDLYGKKSI